MTGGSQEIIETSPNAEKWLAALQRQDEAKSAGKTLDHAVQTLEQQRATRPVGEPVKGGIIEKPSSETLRVAGFATEHFTG